MSEILTPAELKDLTGYARATEQRRVLSEQGIPFKELGPRTIVLSRHVLAWVEGRAIVRHAEPNFSLIR
jgi:hypothetical protein